MLDVRVYRAAFLPAIVALFIAAFSLADRPAPATSPFAADAFDGARAFGDRAPLRNSLEELGRSFPDRAPGSAGDAALADRVADSLGRPDRTGRPAFRVTRERAGDVETVVGVRPGLSSRRIVVLSHRDAQSRPPALAELSGTAAMLELARLFRARELRKTLVLVSTSGATRGFTGASAWADGARDDPVDAVIVLGDLAGTGTAKPWVVPFPLGSRSAPLALQRTVETAVRAEAGRPGGSRASGQWARRALPFTVSEQGVVGGSGLPAVLIAPSGERGPPAGEEVSQERLERFGRAALRAVTAIDGAGPGPGDRSGDSAFAGSPEGIVTMRNVLPDWGVRLLVGTLLLPALLTALDGFFRVRRRHLAVTPWLVWLGATALPVLLAWGWLRALGLTGALDAPDAPVLPLPALDRAAAVALASVVIVLALGWFGIRPLLVRRAGPGGSPIAGSLGAVTGAGLCTLAALVWVANPYAAALMLPAAHLWLFAAAPQTRLRGWAGVAAIAVGVLPYVLLAIYYAQALAVDPLELAWLALLSASSGSLSAAAAAVAGALLACVLALVKIMRARKKVAETVPPEPLVTRGPATYAGPGSLGGTESALRR